MTAARQTSTPPRTAMVLAAGLGVRMRPITDRIPKPLVSVLGRTLLDRILDHLDKAGVERVVVNTHWLADVIERHLAHRSSPSIQLSMETERLETGGGVRAALPHLGSAPIFVINGDVLWIDDGRETALAALANAWRDPDMDALLLLHPVDTAIGYDGPGDFHQLQDGRLQRRAPDALAPLLFAGLQILHPRLFAEAPAGPFSLNVLYDRAAQQGRLFGAINPGAWCHVSTPADIPRAEQFVGSIEGNLRSARQQPAP